MDTDNIIGFSILGGFAGGFILASSVFYQVGERWAHKQAVKKGYGYWKVDEDGDTQFKWKDEQ